MADLERLERLATAGDKAAAAELRAERKRRNQCGECGGKMPETVILRTVLGCFVCHSERWEQFALLGDRMVREQRERRFAQEYPWEGEVVPVPERLRRRWSELVSVPVLPTAVQHVGIMGPLVELLVEDELETYAAGGDTLFGQLVDDELRLAAGEEGGE